MDRGPKATIKTPNTENRRDTEGGNCAAPNALGNIMNSEQASKTLRIVREADIVVYDTETSGLDWKRNYPVGYVIGDEHEKCYIPVRHGGGGNLPDSNVRVPDSATSPIIIHSYEKALAQAFEDRKRNPANKRLIVGHHIKFDAHFSANVGIMLGRDLSCTQNYQALLDEYARSYSLDSCAKAHGVPAKRGQELYDRISNTFGCPADRKSMEHFWKMPGNDDEVVEYSIGDGITTLALWHEQRKDLEEQDMLQVADLEDQLIWTLFRMERRGIKVDTEYLDWLIEEINNKVKEAYEQLPPGFNVRSSVQMKKYVEATGRTDWPLTEAGNPSFTEKWLKTFEEGRRIVNTRKWSNLANSFVVPLRDVHLHQGRVHAQLNQLKADDFGTISGRLSCSYPNLQQVPKHNKELAKLFRKAFIADEGMDFYEGDFSQCEPRLFAHYSQEPALIDGYNSVPFKDMHSVVAEMLKVERDPTAKRMNMGILTGMGPPMFAVHMGYDLDKAERLHRAWFNAFPAIKQFQNDATARMKDVGYVRTLLKRRGRMESIRTAYKAVSKIIQGGNADILKYKMLEMDKAIEAEGDTSHLLMSVHDSFEWQSPASVNGRKFSDFLLHLLAEVQGPPFNLRVPFVIEANKGRNWCEASFGPEK